MLSSIRKTDILLKEKPWLVFIFFTLLAITLRCNSFYRSVIDWDESLYLLVSKAWLEGNPPYTSIWDNKPPGIYVIFSIAFSVMGHSILSIRIVTCLFIAITCFFLYKIGSLIERNGQGIGLLTGILYIVATLLNGGIASNTEIFFTTFVVIAFYLFFLNTFQLNKPIINSYFTLFFIGFLLGIGFEIKYVVLFDFLALSLILLIMFILKVRENRANVNYWSILRDISLLTLGFILPFIIASLYFWLIGHFDDYIYANFTANKLRTVNVKFYFKAPLRAIYNQIQNNPISWLAVPSVIIYLFISKTISTRERWILSSFIICFFSILLCICTVFRGDYYGHYFLQLSPSLCLITAYMIANLVFSGTKVEQYKLKRYLIVGALLVLILTTTGAYKNIILNANYVYFRNVKGNKYWKQDTPALIAEYLKPKIKSDDYIYVVNGQPVIYFLTDAKIPTRYAFPPFLVRRPNWPNITGVDPLKELDLILQKQPAYIIKRNVDDVSNKIFFDKLNQVLDKNYQLEQSIDKFDLYKLNV